MNEADDELLFAEEEGDDHSSVEGGWKVLLVDDEPSVHEVTKMALETFRFEHQKIDFYHAYSAAEGREIMRAEEGVALVLLDVVMESEHAGLELARYIREELGNRETRIVLRTGQPGQAPEERVIVEYDINDYKSKTELTATRLTTTVIAALRAYQYICLLKESRQEIEQTQQNVISMLGTVAEFRSEETGNHVVRVGRYVVRLAELYGLDAAEIEILAPAAELHDMGKVGIPDSILHKPGRLTDEEMDVMRGHAEIGRNILIKNGDRPVLQAASIIAHQHHERWDGKGYPNRLQQDEIHIYGRMTAIADVFDALGSRRCYKEAWGMEEIKALFVEGQGTQFDPHLTELFLENYHDFVSIREALHD